MRAKHIFDSPGFSDHDLLVGPVLWRQVKFFELDEIMRQKEDKDFAQALNGLAVGKLTTDEENLFMSRQLVINGKRSK